MRNKDKETMKYEESIDENLIIRSLFLQISFV